MTSFPPDQRLSLRLATLGDLEDIVTVAQEGFPDDPEFDYRFPYRHKFPEDNRKWIRQEYREYLQQKNKYVVLVVTASDNADKPVALAVWDVSVTMPHRGGDLGVSDSVEDEPRRRDVDATHFREFKKTMEAGFNIFFGSLGTDQIHLWLLCTRPAFRRRGAGTRLCQWGLQHATSQHVYATVLASPMGQTLYKELGFELNGPFVVQADGDSEYLDIWALTYSTGVEARRRRPQIQLEEPLRFPEARWP